MAGTCDQWKSGRSGMARFDTLADAQAAFDTMKAGAQQAMGTTGSDGDDDDDDNGITPDLCESVICSDLNRDDHADAEPLYDTSVQDCCGECSTGYEEDDNGECQAVNGDDEETPWLLYGGVGLAALVRFIDSKEVIIMILLSALIGPPIMELFGTDNDEVHGPLCPPDICP